MGGKRVYEWMHKDDPRLPENQIYQSKAAKKSLKKLNFSDAKLESIAKKRLAAAKKLDDAASGSSTLHVRQEEANIAEARRLRDMLQYEFAILAEERENLKEDKGKDVEAEMDKFVIIGVDEVGVGPLAGPIVSCAVAWEVPTAGQLFGQLLFDGLNDSKKLKPAQREELDVKLRKHAKAFHIAEVSAEEVSVYNPREGSIMAMENAVRGLMDQPAMQNCRAHLLVDYHKIPHIVDFVKIIGQISMPKGDEKSQSIAAASVIAKVYRDKYMAELAVKYPSFGFERNAGYGTQEHRDALKKGLLCPEHRISYAPVAEANLIAMQMCRDADAKGLPTPVHCWWPADGDVEDAEGEMLDIILEDTDKKGKKGKAKAAPKPKGKKSAAKVTAVATASVPTSTSKKRKTSTRDISNDTAEVDVVITVPAAKKPRARKSAPLKERALPNETSSHAEAAAQKEVAPRHSMLTRLSSWLRLSSA